jgi:hypothetical protein
MQYYVLEINGLINFNLHSHFLYMFIMFYKQYIVTSVMLSHNFNERQ